MTRHWQNWFDYYYYPGARHVAVRFDVSPPVVWFTDRYGRFWVLRVGAATEHTELSPGSLRRFAIGADETVWCVTVDDVLWYRRRNEAWFPTASHGQLTDVAEDITVASDGTAWIAARDGTVWTTSDGAAFAERSAVVGFKRLAAGPGDALWGISAGPDSALWRMTANGWFLTNGRDMEEVSVSFGNVVWLVARDGSVRTTTDGNTFVRADTDGGFTDISAGRDEVVWATKADGTVWWSYEGPRSPF